MSVKKELKSYAKLATAAAPPEPQDVFNDYGPDRRDPGNHTVSNPANSGPVILEEVFSTLDSVMLRQEVENLEVLTGFDVNKKFMAQNVGGDREPGNLGEEEMDGAEEALGCCRTGCGDCRPNGISITNVNNQQILSLQRYLRFQNCCFPCCLQKLHVYGPSKEMLGSVHQEWSFLRPHLLVRGRDGRRQFRITGNRVHCGELEFEIYSTSSVPVDNRGKMVGSILMESSEKSGIKFDINLTAEEKALLFGSLFLVDYMYFQETSIDRDDF